MYYVYKRPHKDSNTRICVRVCRGFSGHLMKQNAVCTGAVLSCVLILEVAESSRRNPVAKAHMRAAGLS